MDYLKCDECEFLIDANNAYLHNYDHAVCCSLHPDNIDDTDLMDETITEEWDDGEEPVWVTNLYDAPQYGASSLNEFELPRWYEDSL